MLNNKYKSYSFCIIVCLLGAIFSGIDYIIYNVKLAGIVCVLIICVSIFNVFAYIKDKENDNSKK
jgi:hypothetical protein